MDIIVQKARRGRTIVVEKKRRRRRVTPLGETEMEVLQHVWDLGEATVAEVHERVLRERKVAYTTVMTVLKKLADKGFLNVDDSAQSYVYSAARPPEEVRGELAEDLVEMAFQGSPAALVQTLVRREELTATEREEILRLVNGLGET